MASTDLPALRKINWQDAVTKLEGAVSADDARIIALLAEGRSTPEIAKTLGTNRSAIWRRIQRLKAQLVASGLSHAG
jgi:hypothetical protein